MAGAAPLILPIPHALGKHGNDSIYIVPPPGAQVCAAQFGTGRYTSKRFPITLGGPSRRLSWTIDRSSRGRFSVYVSCGTSVHEPTSLGTAERTLTLDHSQKPARFLLRRGSWRVTHGWIPAGPPARKARAHSADVTEANTGAARNCSSPFMSKAYAVGTGYAARVGLIPKAPAYDNVVDDQIWSDLQSCVQFPSLTASQRDSLFKQMVCHTIYAITGGAGSSWDFEAWRDDPSWFTALDPEYRCQNWGNIPSQEAGTQFDGEVLQGSLDFGNPKKAWLVVETLDGDYVREHILTAKAYGCVKAQGAPGPVVVASDFLDDELAIGPDVGDEFCGNPATTPVTPPPPPLPLGEYYVMNATGGIYWRSGPDWNTAEANPGVGFYPGTAIKVLCYQAGAANVPGSTDEMWEQASWVSGPGSGSGWINEHFINDGSQNNQPSPGALMCQTSPPPPPPPPPPTTWPEQETPNHPVNTFTNYHNASGEGQPISAGDWIQVTCKVYDPTIASVNPDGYWYRIATSPWNNAYYAPANTFMNGDPYGGPYTHNTDFSVANC